MNKLLKNKISTRLTETGLKHDISDNLIQFKMDMQGLIGKLTIAIYIYDSHFVSYAILNNNVSKEKLNIVSEYLHRANYGLLFGNFEIDYTDGEVRFKLTTECENVERLSNTQIDRSVYLPCRMFEVYGNGIFKSMLTDASLIDLITEAENNL